MFFTGCRDEPQPAISSAQSRNSHEARPKCLSSLVVCTGNVPYPSVGGARCTATDLGVIWQNHFLGLEPMERWSNFGDRVDLDMGVLFAASLDLKGLTERRQLPGFTIYHKKIH
jgi:hypothetical protein